MEDKRIEIPADAALRDDLRKPEKIVSPGGRVSIAATRDAATGHADHFWAIALALRAGGSAGSNFYSTTDPTTFHRLTQLTRKERDTYGI